MQGKTILITGATGMVGGHLLDFALESPEVARVIVLTRKATGKSHPKLEEVIHDDFTDYSASTEYFRGVDAAYFCIGIYTGAAPEPVFRKITVDFPVEFAKALFAHSPEARYVLLSGQGADQSGKSKMMFARFKGEAEKSIANSGLKAFHFFRPAYIYPVEKRQEPNFSYRLMRFLYPVLLKPFGKKMSIPSDDLARAMLHAGLKGFESDILENNQIVDLAQSISA